MMKDFADEEKKISSQMVTTQCCIKSKRTRLQAQENSRKEKEAKNE
jgi:hypothetical protein